MTVLLYGRERLLKDEAVAELKAKYFKGPSELDLNFQSFDASDISPAAVLDFLGTAPFLAEKRLAVVCGVEAFEEEQAQKLLAGMRRLPPTACLVLETSETNVKKNGAVRLLAEAAQTTACHTPFERDLPGWIESRARKKGLTFERGLAAHLIDRVGADLASLENVIENLRLFVHPRRNVTLAEAVQLTPSSADEDVFRLAELLLDDRKKDALSLVDGLFRAGTRAPEIVASLAGQLERYKKASAGLASGRGSADLGEEMRVPRPFQQAFFQRAKNTPAARLNAIQKALLNCDVSFKTGQAGERLALERFVLFT